MDFNSIKVRLKLDFDETTEGWDDNFNSIKVRLKRQGVRSSLFFVGFQFHKGTIKTAGSAFARMRENDFNSIKVRLKQHDARKKKVL